MTEPLPLANAAQRLRGKPGRPRKVRPTSPAPLTQQIRRLLDIDAAAAYLSCSPWTIRDLEASGVLKRVRIPTANDELRKELRKLLFDRVDLDALIATRKDGPA